MKDHRLAVGRAFLLATLLILLPAPVASQGDSTTVQVIRVIDGDTIQVCCVFGDRVKVRYIGVDTPETHHPMRGFTGWVDGQDATCGVSGDCRPTAHLLRVRAQYGSVGMDCFFGDCGPVLLVCSGVLGMTHNAKLSELPK